MGELVALPATQTSDRTIPTAIRSKEWDDGAREEG